MACSRLHACNWVCVNYHLAFGGGIAFPNLGAPISALRGLLAAITERVLLVVPAGPLICICHCKIGNPPNIPAKWAFWGLSWLVLMAKNDMAQVAHMKFSDPKLPLTICMVATCILEPKIQIGLAYLRQPLHGFLCRAGPFWARPIAKFEISSKFRSGGYFWASHSLF